MSAETGGNLGVTGEWQRPTNVGRLFKRSGCHQSQSLELSALAAEVQVLRAERSLLGWLMSVESASLRSTGNLVPVFRTLFEGPESTKKIEPAEDIWVIAREDFSEIRNWLVDELPSEVDLGRHAGDEQRAGQPA